MSEVDEVVARLSEVLVNEVWVVTTEFPYEAGELVGVAGTVQKAIELAEEHNKGPLTWSEPKSNTDSAGHTYRWYEAAPYFLNLEKVQ